MKIKQSHFCLLMLSVVLNVQVLTAQGQSQDDCNRVKGLFPDAASNPSSSIYTTRVVSDNVTGCHVELCFFDGQDVKKFSEERIQGGSSPFMEKQVVLRLRTPFVMYPKVIGPNGKTLPIEPTVDECVQVRNKFSAESGVLHAWLHLTPTNPNEICSVKLMFSNDRNLLDFMDRRIQLNTGFGHLIDKEEVTRPNTVIVQVPMWLNIVH